MSASLHNAVENGEGDAARKDRAPRAYRAIAVEENRRAFIRTASHELRTPLNAIIGFSEIISRELHGPLNEPRYRQHADMIHQAGLRMLKLVNEILEIARLEAGAMDLHLHAEHPQVAVEDVAYTLSLELERADLSLRQSIPPKTPKALVDSRALKTILTTLVQNAITRSPKGETVDIAVHADGARMIFEITDRGRPVTPDDLARLMRPLEHGANPLGKGDEGVGFALAIVGLLCKAMSGKFTARAEPGHGLTAVVSLPAAVEP
jgi:signal transduction histidine kinase